jgi:hypothetical protein
MVSRLAEIGAGAPAVSLGQTRGASPRRRATLVAMLGLVALVLGGVLAGSASAALQFPSLGTISGPGGAPFGAFYSESVAVNDFNGHILVADSSVGLVYNYSSAADTSPVAIDGSTTPAGSFGAGRVAVAVDNASGDFYVANATNAVIDKFDASGTLISSFGTGGQLDGSATPAGSFSPGGSGTFGITVNQASHDLYVVDAGNQVVDVFDASGTYLPAKQISAAPNVSFSGYADGIAVNSVTGAVYVSDSGPVLVYEFDATGAYVTTMTGAGTPAGSFGSGYTTVAEEDSTGHVYVADTAHGQVDQFDSSGGYLGQITTAVGGNPGLAVGQATGDVYVSDNATRSIKVFGAAVVLPDATSGAASAIGKTTAVLHGHVDPVGGGEITGCRFEYVGDTDFQATGFTGAPSAACTQAAPISGAEDVSAAISGLTTTTTYHTRLLATNANGTSAGDGQPFDTAGAVVITTAPATQVGSGTATLHGRVDSDGGGDITDCHFDYINDTDYQNTGFVGAQSRVCSPATPIVSVSDVAADITGLDSATTYDFRVVATNSDGTSRSDASMLTTLPLAVEESAAVANLTATTADLMARINPAGLDTTYHFEWGTTTSYGASIPAPDAGIGSGTAPVTVSQHIVGLSAGTTYHFRIIATDANGVTTGPNHTFVYNVAGAQLPNGRAYELVSPPYKQGARPDINDISTDGNRVIVNALGNFGDANNDVVFGATYQLTRGPGGWTSVNIDPPAAAFPWDQYLDANADQSRTLFFARSASQSVHNYDVWTRDSDGALHDIGPVFPPSKTAGPPGIGVSQPGGTQLNFEGASRDLSKVLIVLTRPSEGYGDGVLWPGDTTLPSGSSLYEYSAGHGGVATLVGVDDAGHPLSQCGVTAGPGEKTPYPTQGTISADGSKIFMTARGADSWDCGGDQPPVDELFARIDQAHTVAISAPVFNAACTTPACQGAPSADAVFQAASDDGSKVFFTSTGQLTDDAAQDNTIGDRAAAEAGRGCAATTGPSGCKLYLYDFGNPAGHELIDASAGSPSPRVQGTAAVSRDGSHVYFVAKGVLTGPQQGANGTAAVDGANNLYVFERDARFPQGRTAFIARLSAADSSLWQTLTVGGANPTPDGRFLAFPSVTDLTPDDSSTARQIFRYDAQAGELVRVSIGQHGFNDNGNTDTFDADIPGGSKPGGTGLTISDDGAYVVFRSAKGLTPGALDGQATDTSGVVAQNIYVYHDGTVDLISDGRDTSSMQGESLVSFAGGGLTGSGDDVFFRTTSALVGQDGDTQADIYDARIGGGFATAPSPAPCQGEGCRAPASLGPATPAAASVTFVGPGDGSSAPSRPAAGKVSIVVRRSVKGSTLSISAKVPAAGVIKTSGALTKSVRRSVSKAGTYTLRVSLSAKAKRQLKSKRKVKVKLRVTFVPRTGSSSVASVSLTVKA